MHSQSYKMHHVGMYRDVNDELYTDFLTCTDTLKADISDVKARMFLLDCMQTSDTERETRIIDLSGKGIDARNYTFISTIATTTTGNPVIDAQFLSRLSFRVKLDCCDVQNNNNTHAHAHAHAHVITVSSLNSFRDEQNDYNKMYKQFLTGNADKRILDNMYSMVRKNMDVIGKIKRRL
jgi:hypothetical protein